MDNKKKEKIITSDYLILGSGIAGLFAAIKLAKKGTVTIITKDQLTESNSNYAQGGIAAALIPPDTTQKHFDDTMKAGEYHNNPTTVAILTKEGPDRVKELIDLGVKFDHEEDELLLSKEGAHSEARVLHHKDFTGAEIINILIKHVKKNKNIRIFESLFIYELLSENNVCTGCLGFYNSTHFQFNASSTILATGGAGKLYKFTSNPDVSTGDGFVLAHDIGCELEDMEFIQFHPTTFLFNKEKSSVFLITEAIRGDGAILKNSNNESFMRLYDKNENLAARDIVSRAIYKESNAGKLPVYLDFSNLKGIIQKKYPTIYAFCKNKNIDITKNQLPITPAAHYIMGGIKTTEFAETSVKNLYAVGEVACTGVHGSNRLASNSLLEAIVFANRATEKILSSPKLNLRCKTVQINNIQTTSYDIQHIQSKIQTLMWEKAGIIRSKQKLKEALFELESLSYLEKESILNKGFCETKNMLKLSKIIIQSCLKREQSIGAHFIL